MCHACVIDFFVYRKCTYGARYLDTEPIRYPRTKIFAPRPAVNIIFRFPSGTTSSTEQFLESLFEEVNSRHFSFDLSSTHTAWLTQKLHECTVKKIVISTIQNDFSRERLYI